jgi:hypothetical protein
MPRFDEDGNFVEEVFLTRADGSPKTRKVVVFGLHKVARIANRVSVNRMIRKLEEVPVDRIQEAALAFEAQLEARRQEAAAQAASERAATQPEADEAEGHAAAAAPHEEA